MWAARCADGVAPDAAQSGSERGRWTRQRWCVDELAAGTTCIPGSLLQGIAAVPNDVSLTDIIDSRRHSRLFLACAGRVHGLDFAADVARRAARPPSCLNRMTRACPTFLPTSLSRLCQPGREPACWRSSLLPRAL
jgi:hypothetical protein